MLMNFIGTYDLFELSQLFCILTNLIGSKNAVQISSVFFTGFLGHLALIQSIFFSSFLFLSKIAKDIVSMQTFTDMRNSWKANQVKACEGEHVTNYNVEIFLK